MTFIPKCPLPEGKRCLIQDLNCFYPRCRIVLIPQSSKDPWWHEDGPGEDEDEDG